MVMAPDSIYTEDPKVEVLSLADGVTVMKHLERIGRTCYKSEDKITDDSYVKFVRGLIDKGHHAMIEHCAITVYFYTDRGVSHEMVRHRLAAFAQASTRYCNYSQDKFGASIHAIKPFYFDPKEPALDVAMWNGKVVQMNAFDVWFTAMRMANWAYLTLTKDFKKQPQEARGVLPTCTSTEIYITANLREWRHIFNLRALGLTGAPHPDMRKVMLMALVKMNKEFPLAFEDIYKGCQELDLFTKYGVNPD